MYGQTIPEVNAGAVVARELRVRARRQRQLEVVSDRLGAEVVSLDRPVVPAQRVAGLGRLRGEREVRLEEGLHPPNVVGGVLGVVLDHTELVTPMDIAKSTSFLASSTRTCPKT